MVTGDVQQKDVILAVFGGRIGLAGLILVFQGFLVTAYGARESMGKRKSDWFKRVVKGAITALLVTGAAVGVSMFWLLTARGFYLAVVLFCASLVLVLGLGAYVSSQMVK